MPNHKKTPRERVTKPRIRQAAPTRQEGDDDFSFQMPPVEPIFVIFSGSAPIFFTGVYTRFESANAVVQTAYKCMQLVKPDMKFSDVPLLHVVKLTPDAPETIAWCERFLRAAHDIAERYAHQQVSG